MSKKGAGQSSDLTLVIGALLVVWLVFFGGIGTVTNLACQRNPQLCGGTSTFSQPTGVVSAGTLGQITGGGTSTGMVTGATTVTGISGPSFFTSTSYFSETSTATSTSAFSTSTQTGGFTFSSSTTTAMSTAMSTASSTATSTTATTSDFNFGSGDWTLDFWVRFNSLPMNTYDMTFYSLVKDGRNLIEMYLDGWSTGQWCLGIIIGTGGSNPLSGSCSNTFSLSTGTWYMFAYVRQGGTIYFFKGGSSVGTVSISGSLATFTIPLRIGVVNAGFSPLDGNLDEYRVSNVARWTSNFTPPTSPYIGDSYTVLLLHMDGTNGSTIFPDASGSGHTCSSINGASVDTSGSEFGGASGKFVASSSEYLSCS